MSIATRNALHVVLVASTAVAALAALLWLDSLAFDLAGYSTGSNNKLFIAWLAATSAFLAWRMLADPSELVWGLMVSATAMTFVLGVNANLSPSVSCPTYGGGILGFLSSFGPRCYGRTDVSTIALWAITVSSLITALLALGLPIIELWDRTRVEQKD